jgi:hypothetical protein
MRRIGIGSLLIGGWLAWGAGQAALSAEPEGGGAEFKEVYDLIRSNLAGINEADLDRTAARALAGALSPKVTLVTNGAASSGPEKRLVSKSSRFEGEIGYVRIGRVEEGLAQAVREVCDKLQASNKLNGVVLDLRYAGGNDYAAAVAVADAFVTKEQPLLDWGNGTVRSKEKETSLGLPAAILVNRQTAGAAEALAAVMRETGAGLLLGSSTAGQAMIAKEFPLNNGDRLRIATTPIRLGDGSALSAQGVKPDISVEVSPENERTYYEDAYHEIAQTNLAVGSDLTVTNLASSNTRTNRRTRINEADLVRARREGFNSEEFAAAHNAETEKPVVQDPALARALDVLKGLAVVRHSRS